MARAIALAAQTGARSDRGTDESDDLLLALQALAGELMAASSAIAPVDDRGDTHDIAFWSAAVLHAIGRLTKDEPVSIEALQALAGRMSAIADAMRFDFLYDRRRRIFSIGYRLPDAEGARATRRVVLRPARVRGPAGEFRGDRQGRRAAASLVPPRSSGDQRARPGDPHVLGRHDVRVPDAADADADVSRDTARSELPRQRGPPDRLRQTARRSLGDFGIGLRVHRSRGQLSVPGRSACPDSVSSEAW